MVKSGVCYFNRPQAPPGWGWGISPSYQNFGDDQNNPSCIRGRAHITSEGPGRCSRGRSLHGREQGGGPGPESVRPHLYSTELRSLEIAADHNIVELLFIF